MQQIWHTVGAQKTFVFILLPSSPFRLLKLSKSHKIAHASCDEVISIWNICGFQLPAFAS